MEWWDRMNEAREARGWTHEELARRSGISAQNLRKYSAGKVEKPRGDVIEKIAQALGKPPLWLALGMFAGDVAPRQVPVKGFIGAGARFYPIADGGEEMVDAPQGASVETVAAEVRGDSMMPVLQEGWLLFWSRMLPPTECLNSMCVCHLADGRILVKIVTRGTTPTTFHLMSANASPILDAVLDYCSPIDWIKPR